MDATSVSSTIVSPAPATQAPTEGLWDALSAFKVTPFPSDYDANVRRFYSPGDQCHAALKALISSATESLFVSMYGEDDAELTDIIIAKAGDPAIFVQVNLDKSQAGGRGEVPLVAKLRACPNTRVAVGMSEKHKINHLKMAIIDGLYTIGGSMNWSSDGESAQSNELAVIRSRAVAHEATTKLNRDHAFMVAQESAQGAAK